MHNRFRELRQKGQETSDGVARPNHSLSNDRRQRNPHDDFGYNKGEQKMPFSQQEDLRRAATGGWHPSAEGLPNTPEHRMRGGVIDGKLDALTSYLEDYEHEIFKNARLLKKRGMNQKDFPPKERIVYSMYDSILNHKKGN
jgi:hypothetical protein